MLPAAGQYREALPQVLRREYADLRDLAATLGKAAPGRELDLDASSTTCNYVCGYAQRCWFSIMTLNVGVQIYYKTGMYFHFDLAVVGQSIKTSKN